MSTSPELAQDVLQRLGFTVDSLLCVCLATTNRKNAATPRDVDEIGFANINQRLEAHQIPTIAYNVMKAFRESLGIS